MLDMLSDMMRTTVVVIIIWIGIPITMALGVATTMWFGGFAKFVLICVSGYVAYRLYRSERIWWQKLIVSGFVCLYFLVGMGAASVGINLDGGYTPKPPEYDRQSMAHRLLAGDIRHDVYIEPRIQISNCRTLHVSGPTNLVNDTIVVVEIAALDPDRRVDVSELAKHMDPDERFQLIPITDGRFAAICDISRLPLPIDFVIMISVSHIPEEALDLAQPMSVRMIYGARMQLMQGPQVYEYYRGDKLQGGKPWRAIDLTYRYQWDGQTLHRLTSP